jgi:23S rRNA pseudouridine1911/1915/1917 synthase
LAVCKPAGLLVQGDRSGDPTLLEAARAYLKREYAKPGNVYLGLVHRLDRNVSGVVLLARTSKAASRLAAAFRAKQVAKSYLAVTAGRPPAATGELRHWLAAAGDRQGVTRASAEPFAGAREAVLRYRIADEGNGCCLLGVEPVTGRRHQIRAQLALAGCPLLGDVKYGASSRLPGRRIALHALRLELAHPVGGAPLALAADPDPDWPWPPG